MSANVKARLTQLEKASGLGGSGEVHTHIELYGSEGAVLQVQCLLEASGWRCVGDPGTVGLVRQYVGINLEWI